MEGRIINGFLVVVIIILLLSIYWFIPFKTTEFDLESNSNSNFSVNSYESTQLQFYENMRFPDKKITYKIENCPIKRKKDMERALEIMEQETILEFYPVEKNQQITITCEETTKLEGKLFIAGEGGPTNITIAGNFNVIEAGKILLMKDSECERPNVAIHELLHVLGFDHSKNPKNIMYEISKCDQVIGEDILDFIEKIYSIPSNPDLLFEDAKASMHGKYLDINFSIRNNGLKDAEESKVKVLANGKEIKEIEIPEIDIGYGRKVSIANLWVKQIDVQKIEFIIETDFEELDKANNRVSFEIKK